MFKLLALRKFAIALIFLQYESAVGADADVEYLVDPTRPLNFEVRSDDGDAGLLDVLQSAISRFELSSVLIRENDRIAVINSQRVRVGEKIGTAKVTEINSNSVVLDINGEFTELFLYSSSIKTLVKGEG